MARRPRRSYNGTVRDRTRRHARNQGRRRRRRRGWPLLIFGFLLCLLVADYFLWDSERSAMPPAIASVDRPTSAKPPQPPAPARAQAVEELRSKLPVISRSHAGTHGVMVFDPYSGKTVSLNADRPFVAASLSKLYALLTLYRHPVGYTMTLRECAKFMIKESDNTAELLLNRYLEEEKIEAELHRIGADSTRYWHPINT